MTAKAVRLDLAGVSLPRCELVNCGSSDDIASSDLDPVAHRLRKRKMIAPKVI